MITLALPSARRSATITARLLSPSLSSFRPSTSTRTTPIPRSSRAFSSSARTRSMALNIPLRKNFSANEPALGSWLTMPGAAHARNVASVPGISWVCIDAEHGMITDNDLYTLANSVAAAGVSPLIRVPAEDPWWIKRALDAGAHGLIIPMVHDAEMTRKIVSASKYPPLGIRGYGPMWTHATGLTGLEYGKHANAELLVIVQIESAQAVKNIDEILAVEGLDVAFIGPFDLAYSMGVQYGSEAHEKAIEDILAACKKAGKKAAVFCTSGEQSAKRRAQGFDMISVAMDIDVVYGGYKAHVAAALEQSSTVTPNAGYGTK